MAFLFYTKTMMNEAITVASPNEIASAMIARILAKSDRKMARREARRGAPRFRIAQSAPARREERKGR
jgi:hypothetical protein